MNKFASVSLISAGIFSLGTSAMGWTALDDKGIRSKLSGKSVVYEEGGRSEFRKNGTTIFRADKKHVGKWGVNKNRMCTKYPETKWICFSVEAKGTRDIRFIAVSNGRISKGKIK